MSVAGIVGVSTSRDIYQNGLTPRLEYWKVPNDLTRRGDKGGAAQVSGNAALERESIIIQRNQWGLQSWNLLNEVISNGTWACAVSRLHPQSAWDVQYSLVVLIRHIILYFIQFQLLPNKFLTRRCEATENGTLPNNHRQNCHYGREDNR